MVGITCLCVCMYPCLDVTNTLCRKPAKTCYSIGAVWTMYFIELRVCLFVPCILIKVEEKEPPFCVFAVVGMYVMELCHRTEG